MRNKENKWYSNVVWTVIPYAVAFAGLVSYAKSMSSGIQATFPTFEGRALDQDEIATINTSLELTLTQEEAVERAKDNACTYVTSYYNESMIEHKQSGSCTLLSDNIVLTAYHVVDAQNVSKYYDVALFIQTQNGEQYRVQGGIAGSPGYDFALVELEDTVDGVESIAVGPRQEEGELTYVSMKSGTAIERELTYNGAVGFWRQMHINLAGGPVPPSIYVKETLVHGESGSAVLQNGKIIGLVFANALYGGALISDQLSDFLNCAISQPCED